MHRTKQLIALQLILAPVALAGCSSDATRGTAASSIPASSVVTAPADEPQTAAPDSGLGGTSWQLLKIMSMDDTTYTPDDPALYTLEFGSDGSMKLRADCNRGSGSWSSESAGQLQFAVIAVTQAECAADSLHMTYLRQFQWVRSYVIEGGYLFLATLADGSIIEFEPASGGRAD
jgi:heat shock protein HslJ